MDTQLEYLQTQVNATLGWRLKNHHGDLLKELQSLFTPMSDTVTPLQMKLSHCKNSMQTLSEEITAKANTTTVGGASVQTEYEALPGKTPILISSCHIKNAYILHQLAFFSAVALVNLGPLLPYHDLLQTATSNAYLDGFTSEKLR